MRGWPGRTPNRSSPYPFHSSQIPSSGAKRPPVPSPHRGSLSVSAILIV
nr:MAG TPA: hypothetical protein [Caudoviricetes sp.]